VHHDVGPERERLLQVDANVLSTTSRAPAAWATPASAEMSAMFRSGLVGVSIQTSFVRPGMMAAATAAGSVTSAGV
jgi:hypothetical protein